MVQSPTKGHGTGDERPDARSAQSTHESAPEDLEALDGEGEVLARGSTLGRYLVLERLGAGAMGVVYAAYDPELDRKVAIKILRPYGGSGDQDRRRARLVLEAKAIAKLSHPNVVGVFDVGVHDGQVFLAMEYLGGGTLRRWMNTKRPWREIVDMFVEIGRGLAAAHAEGLVHRDFKPDNVLLDKNGKPKVVDFGLVRLSSRGDSAEDIKPDRQVTEVSSTSTRAATGAALTRTGALTGTPAYMAPEQFVGSSIDPRTDQFAFCVALYEALSGRRPFAGESVVALADSVTSGRISATPSAATFPSWIRAAILRGLATRPADRFDKMDTLLHRLSNDPSLRRRRWIVRSAAVVATALVGLSITRSAIAKRREIERQVSEHVRAADSALTSAGQERHASSVVRTRALKLFDTFQQQTGEGLWEEALDRTRKADVAYREGIQHLDAAAALSPSPTLDARLADALVEFAKMEGRSASERAELVQRLEKLDSSGARLRELHGTADVRFSTRPDALEVRVEAYDASYHAVGPSKSLGKTPLAVSLPPGSYRLFVIGGDEGRVSFTYPVVLSPNETFKADVSVPRLGQVSDGFVFVPAGRFLFGSDDEEIRTTFLETVPLHEISTKAFLIAKNETTIGDWIAFLDSLPATKREQLRPQGRKDGRGGFVDIQKRSDGTWEFNFRATDTTFHASQGENLRYAERERRVAQDWMRFPVSGISPRDAEEYASWLSQTGKVPGARLCTEQEWERAARGADAREFPSGNKLMADDANFDLTYGRKSGGYGPDQVGSHPASVSPFGVNDLVGNVWDITTSVLDRGQYVARGGSFYQCLRTLMSANRDPMSADTRDHTVGVRICADLRDAS